MLNTLLTTKQNFPYFSPMPSEKAFVVSGGFTSETEVRSTDPSMNTDLLEGNHVPS
jgi:hypothetical protein